MTDKRQITSGDQRAGYSKLQNCVPRARGHSLFADYFNTILKYVSFSTPVRLQHLRADGSVKPSTSVVIDSVHMASRRPSLLALTTTAVSVISRFEDLALLQGRNFDVDHARHGFFTCDLLGFMALSSLLAFIHTLSVVHVKPGRRVRTSLPLIWIPSLRRTSGVFLSQYQFPPTEQSEQRTRSAGLVNTNRDYDGLPFLNTILKESVDMGQRQTGGILTASWRRRHSPVITVFLRSSYRAIACSTFYRLISFTFPKDIEIKRAPSGLMLPFVKGKMREGIQMPLRPSITPPAC
ncbi:hypothetical protein BDZ89DRAFT_1038186 [Hymenopellis radicata]|nr:hypothetical protein BDZ89DRAFT_1038186 [Hymenopellis radicata]